MTKIIETKYDQEHGTQYYNIESISNWDLERLWRLLKAEKQRASCVDGFDRGPPELLQELNKLAEEREWRIREC